MFENILELIKKYNTIIIHRHTKPDGDALGSQIGLKHIINKNFPDKNVYIVGETSRYSDIIRSAAMDEISDAEFRSALSIILDSGSSHLISDTRYTLAAHTARIDHHLFCETIADTEVIDPSYESCCGMITDFACESNLTITKEAAEALYTGMVTDSGRFRYDSTNARTHRLASALMEAGIDTSAIYKDLYSDTYESRKLKAQFTLKVNFTKNNVAYIYTSKDELQSYNTDTFSISRGMVGIMADIKDVHAWVNFTETDEGVLCELRSDSLNINQIAVKYGGGGHIKASGATVPDYNTAMAMLSDLDALCEEAK